MIKFTPVNDAESWNRALLRLPQSHILQSWEWGAFKSRHGWSANRWLLQEKDERPRAAALVLRRRLGPFPFGVLYVPKGPLLAHDDHEAWTATLSHLEHLAHEQRALFVKIDPDVRMARADVPAHLRKRRWRPSSEQIQFRNTMLLDLTEEKEALLARMKSKWRYNVRLSQRRGVKTRAGSPEDLTLLYDMYQETALRDGFVIRPIEYYQDAWGSFMQKGLAQPLIAEVEGEAVAMVLLFRFGERAWYMYGASRNEHRDKMPNHRLQWEAIVWAKSVGCTVYDLWGAPDEPVESDPMWGVYRFKQGFGAELVQHIGAYDYPTWRPSYWLYTAAMPRMLALMRRRFWRRIS
jgi:peptidoglycan pentaglycine glycine transferase (the first glycine)